MLKYDLTPVRFKEANRVYRAPETMNDEECASLHVFTDDQCTVSCWSLSLFQRLYILFTGRIWLHQLSGNVVYPTALSCERSPFAEVSDGET